MNKVKELVNHPLSKAVVFGICGAIILLEEHPIYAGLCFGYGFRELLLAFKSE